MTGRPRSGAWIFAAALLPPTLLRASLHAPLGGEAGTGAADLAGLGADLLVSGLFVVVFAGCARVSRWLGMAVLALWLAAHVVNHESVLALGALASWGDVGYLADATFLRGSALAPLRPWLYAAVAAATLSAGWLATRARPGPRLLAAALGAAALGLGAYTFVPWRSDAAQWRQTHVLLQSFGSSSGGPAVEEGGLSEAVSLLRADLAGSPRLPLPARAGRNVLLVFVESVSGAFVPSLASAQGRRAEPAMPNLDRFARQHLAFSSFVVHQVNTNRGLYAGLCGDLPKLLAGTPRMSEYAGGGRKACLPERLRDAGYRTVYLQAAPLAFMMKDQFMARIGFEEVLGAASLKTAHARSAWGVDDRTLFEAAEERIRLLESQDEPWLLTLLTVGTHHPYLLPPDPLPKGVARGSDRFGDAIGFADWSLGRFLRALEATGVLEDTLVLLTTDESRGLRAPDDRADATAELASQAWGFLVVAAPELGPGRVDEVFGLIDLPVSVLDYLGLELGLEPGLLGRSVFRVYDRGRFLPFANTRRRAAGAVLPDGGLVLCRRGFQRCARYEMPGGRIFGAQRRSVDDRGAAETLRAVASWSLRGPAPVEGARVFELMAEHAVPLVHGEARMLHGGQNVALGPRETLEVELVFEARGAPGEGRVVEVRHVLRDPIRVRLDETLRVPVGERYRLAYSLTADESGVGKLGCMSTARLDAEAPGAVILDFEAARMTISPASGAPAAAAGLRIESNGLAAARE